MTLPFFLCHFLFANQRQSRWLPANPGPGIDVASLRGNLADFSQPLTIGRAETERREAAKINFSHSSQLARPPGLLAFGGVSARSPSRSTSAFLQQTHISLMAAAAQDFSVKVSGLCASEKSFH